MTLIAHRLWRNVVRIFPEVENVGVGIGIDLRGSDYAEVLGEDDVDKGRDDGIAGKGRVFEVVLPLL